VLFGHAKSFGSRNDTDLGAVDAGQSDFRYPNLTIDSVVAILCYGTSPKLNISGTAKGGRPLFGRRTFA
jgi:hypothetical protein